MKKNFFKIVTPLYNAEDWISLTIKTVLSQDYDNFEWVIIDDMSTDNSVNIIKDMTSHDSRVKLIENKEKKFALKNIHEGTEHGKPKKNDVIVILDGDDWFPNPRVLTYLNEVYQDKDTWMTYGNHLNWPDIENEPFPIFGYPSEVVENNKYRNFRYLASHLRTYKYGLWKKVNKEQFLDENGEYWQTCADIATMLPLCELAGPRAKFLSKALYVYNNVNPLNDYKVYTGLQKQEETKIRNKKPHDRLEKL